MLFIDSPSTDPHFNLALEEHVFEQMDRSQSYFLLWQNENTIVVGVHQNTAQEINAAYVREHGIHVVRRLTGGGAVYHDSGNLNYTIITDQTGDGGFDFAEFAKPVLAALAQLQVRAECSGRNDILINGKKISGSAQMVRRGRVLHHGCIMLDSNLENVTNALQVRESKYRSKGIPSVRSRVTTINREAPAPISMETFRQTLTDCIRAGESSFEERFLTQEDLAQIEDLRRNKYETWDWNYGKSPDYDVVKEEKFPAGLITAYLQIHQGRIVAVRFYGDFFGEEDPRKLEEAMRGLALDETLAERLKALDSERVFRGITAKEIAELLTD